MMLQQLRTARGLIRGPVRGWMSLAVLGSLVIAGLDMLGVAAMLPLMQLMTGADPSAGALGRVSDLLGTSDTQALIVAVAAVITLTFVLKALASIGFRWWLLGHTTAMEAEASTELLRRYVLAPYWAHRQRELSIINRNIGLSVSQTFSQVILGLISLIADLLTIIAVTLVLLLVSPLATLFAALFFGSLGWSLQRVLRRRQTDVGEAMAQSDLDAWNALMPGIHGFREARLTSSASMFVDKYLAAKMDRARAQRRQTIFGELPKYVLEIGFITGIVGITLLLFATESPEAALSVLGVFAASCFRLLPTLNRLVATVGGIRTGRVGLGLLTREMEVLNAAGYHSEASTSEERYRGDVVFRGVSYAYHDAEHNVLHDVSTVLPRGRTTAIVGSSGAGKTTLLDILLGLLTPTDGTVVCGGRSIHDDLPAWYAGLGVVPQDVFVIDDTLRNNIAYGQDTTLIDDERLSEAIRLAQLTSLVDDLPSGLNTRLGERGVRLSGGQRQRVGIARALYRRPEILVLDEATSSLDNATERKISQTIESLSGSITVVVVAHRLSTVRNADKVVFMTHGRVTAEGTFDAVKDLSPEFANLVALGKLG